MKRPLLSRVKRKVRSIARPVKPKDDRSEPEPEPELTLPAPDGAAPGTTKAAESAKSEVLGSDEKIVETLRKRFRRAPKKGDPNEAEWRRRTQELLDAVSPDRVPHFMVRRVVRERFRIGRGLSFKAMLVQDSELRKTLGLPVASWLLDQKVSAYRFVDAIGLRRPKADLETYRFDDLSFEPPMVIKPRQSTGSKGCYLIYSETDILHVRDGEQLGSYEAMRSHAHHLMQPDRRGRELPDHWIFEEMILEDYEARTPARDLKYFCFYGEVALILEVVRENGESRYSFLTPERANVTPGGWEYEYFEGDGTTDDEIELAREVSLQIPHAFCRIDMLKGEDGLVFGEFTPRPGGYHRFNGEWDRKLGEAWARAQHRLQLDLLAGKTFDPFLRSTSMLDS